MEMLYTQHLLNEPSLASVLLLQLRPETSVQIRQRTQQADCEQAGCLGHSLSDPPKHGISQNSPVRSRYQGGAMSVVAPPPQQESPCPCKASRS